jgi:hypothetical protein
MAIIPFERPLSLRVATGAAWHNRGVRAALLGVLLLAACKHEARHQAAPADAAPPAKPTLTQACKDALAAPGTELTAVLAACTPCGVPWDPLIAASGFDPENPPQDLPSMKDLIAVLDACHATCNSDARADVQEALEPGEYGRKPSAPWRAVADKCTGALPLDEHTRRFARGTWYALEQIARVAPPTSLEWPLPPLTSASTAFAFPRTDALAADAPRMVITVNDKQQYLAVLPWVTLDGGHAALVPWVGSDYPGDLVELADLGAKVTDLGAAMVMSPHAADHDTTPVILAPRALPIARILEVAAKLPVRVGLGATAEHAAPGPWPEPIHAVKVLFQASPGGGGVPTIDVSSPGAPIAHRIADAALPAGVKEVHLVLPATAQAADLAYALAALAPRGVDAADITLANP